MCGQDLNFKCQDFILGLCCHSKGNRLIGSGWSRLRYIVKTLRVPLPKHVVFSLPPQITLGELVVARWGVPETTLTLTDSLRVPRPPCVVVVMTGT